MTTELSTWDLFFQTPAKSGLPTRGAVRAGGGAVGGGWRSPSFRLGVLHSSQQSLDLDGQVNF